MCGILRNKIEERFENYMNKCPNTVFKTLSHIIVNNKKVNDIIIKMRHTTGLLLAP